MITLDLLRLLKYRRFITSSWIRKEWHRRGFTHEGVVALLVSIGAIAPFKEGYLWIEEADEVELAEKMQILMCCMTDWDFIDFATSHTYAQAFCLTEVPRSKTTECAAKIGCDERPSGYRIYALDDQIIEIVQSAPGISPKSIAMMFPDRTYMSVYAYLSRMEKRGAIRIHHRKTPGKGCAKVFPVEAVA